MEENVPRGTFGFSINFIYLCKVDVIQKIPEGILQYALILINTNESPLIEKKS